MHLGHYSHRWNPKMKPFIYGQKDNVHLLDLVKSYKYFKRVLVFLTKASARGQKILFIGTSERSAAAVTRAARRCRSFYVTEKWLGGMLTNWDTLQRSTETLRQLERQERSGALRRRPKKELASALRRKQKLVRTLGGVRWMTHLPQIAVIIGQDEERNALRECNRMGIRHITLLDTNNDPTRADLFIPANDDSLTSVNLILNEFVTAIRDGRSILRQRRKRVVKRKIRRSPPGTAKRKIPTRRRSKRPAPSPAGVAPPAKVAGRVSAGGTPPEKGSRALQSPPVRPTTQSETDASGHGERT